MKTFVSLIVLLSGIALSQTASISPLGPEGGVISHLEGSLNDSVVLAVVRERDLYQSLNGGDSWTKIDIPELQINQAVIFGITFHPNSADIVLLPTSVGLYRSTDKGLNWSAVQGFPTPKYSVKYVPGIPNALFGSDEMGVLRSTDGGNTWQSLNDGDRPIFQIAVHPQDNSALSLRIIASRGFDDTTCVILSTDGGNSWKPQTKGLPKGLARHVYALELDGTGLGTKDFRAIIGTADGLYAFQTDQLDTTWQSIKRTDVSFPIQGVVTSGQLRFDLTDTTGKTFDLFIATNASEYDGPPKPSATNNGIFKISSFAGTISSNFSAITNLYPQLVGDITSVFIPTKGTNRNKIYLGTTNGVFISEDNGVSWQQKNNGIKSRIISNVVSMQSSVGTVQTFASVFGGSVYRSSDEGVTWVPSNSGLTNPYVTTVITDDKRNAIYAGTVYTIYRSTDAGMTWQPIYVPDTSEIVNRQLYTTLENHMTIRVSPKNPDLIMFYSPAYGLNITTTNGKEPWTPITLPPGFDTVHVPENIEFDPIDSLTIYITGKGIYKSTNLGQTWDFNITSNLPTQGTLPAVAGSVPIEMLSPTINPNNNKEIFLSTVYDQKDGPPYRLFRTTNGGISWDSLNQRLPVYDVQYDKYDTKRLIASGAGGIFATVDGGSSWKILANPLPQNPFYLVGAHATDANTYFVGSENGAYKIVMNERSKLTVDSSEYNFGSIQLGKDTTMTIFLRNTLGARNVIVRFAGLTDTNAFHFLGPDNFDIPQGSSVSFQVRFSPKTAGNKTAVLRFRSSDALFDSLQFILRGHSFERYSLEKFTYDFGSVLVGKDSVVAFTIDNQFGLQPINLTYLGNTDTVSFHYEGNKTVVINTGTIASIPVRFTPKSTGVKKAYLYFTTNDIKLPTASAGVQMRFQGTGVVKNIATRRVLLDTSINFISSDSSKLFEYYKFFTQSLEQTGITVDFQQRLPFSQYNAAVYVQPNEPLQIDSLQQYVMNGGTVVALGDYGNQTRNTFNGIFHDSTWKEFGVKPGIQFENKLIADISLKDSTLPGLVTAYPYRNNVLTYKADSLVLHAPGSLKIDTSLNNVIPLFVAQSPNLVSIDPSDTTLTPNPIPFAVIAAYSQIGKGKVIAISDYDFWWNGDLDDTTKPYGIFGGNNLRFAFNIFGLIENLLAHLPEPTPQEAYKLISIPYSFSDSSVLALFKDLGPPNKLVWRMFGKWSDQKGAYAEFPEDFKAIRRGEGYWLITKQPTTINFGTTDVQGTEDDFEIELQPGYNMIGNPFPYEVSWANSFKADSVERVLWFYDKKFDSTSSIMKPFQGYFIKNRGKKSKLIKISSAQLTSASVLPKDDPDTQLEPQEWKLQISASSKKSSDEQNYIGMLKTAVNGFDDNDFSEPPTAPNDYISLSIRNHGEQFAADYRSISREGQFWDMRVVSSADNTPVAILLNKFGSLPTGFMIYILDKVKERAYDVTESLTHTLSFGKKEYSRDLRVIVGTRQFVEANTNGIPIIPLEYALSQNYPNPFNPTTSIRYTISNSSHVKLEIFNTLGQKVRTLVQQFQPIGTYLAEWDGTNDEKKSVASGVYYYRLQANPKDASHSYINVKKMTLIK